MSKTKKILIGLAGVAVVGTVGLYWAARRYSSQMEPYIKERVVEYLTQRFESEVEIGSLSVQFTRVPSLRLLLTRGRDVIARVEGRDISLRHRGRRDIPPMFAIKQFTFEVDLGRLFEPTKRVAMVHMDGMKMVVPPKGERPSLSGKKDKDEKPSAPEAPPPAPETRTRYMIEQVIIENSELVILPKAAGRKPLEFELHRVALNSVALSEALTYDAELTNPKPIGLIRSKGSFGPWNADSPADTPLSGEYKFTDADLGVFKAIAGTLQSTGKFSGTLNQVAAKGEANVPNFRLKKGGRSKRLETSFEAEVDGTNGNTVLKPVHARLGTSEFTTAGAVIKHDGDKKRTIDLKAHVPNGELRDFLELAVQGNPPMSGRITLETLVKVPPLAGAVSEKLILDGHFTVRKGQFLKETLQDKIDQLSRRAQGQPKNEAIDNVFSELKGVFKMEDENLTLRDVQFLVPGAQVDMAGSLDLDQDQLDMSGTVKLDAKVSQTMTGWKRWVLKPVDPLFSKNGAGTFLKIKIGGTTKNPQFSASR